MSIMGPENAWLLSLTLASKCGGPTADLSRLLGFAAIVLLASLATALHHWAYPGGSAWGRYWWARKGRSPGPTPAVDCDPPAAIPGPWGLPFLGSMDLMSGLAHRRLAAAADALGARRLMALSLGGTRVVVTADPAVAREILASSSFADRPAKESAYGLMFDRSIGFAPYSTYWRALRRIATTHLFCPKQISSAEPQRARIAAQMVSALRAAAAAGDVQVRHVLKQASLNNVMGSVFGRTYKLELGEAADGEMKELRSFVDEGYDLLGKLNWSDHLPALAGLDVQGIRARCSRLMPRVNRFVTRIIDEHRRRRLADPDSALMAPDFVDVLLSLQGGDRLSDSDMVAVLWEMIFRGTDTVAVLIEWVLARLVLHRDVQERVHQELEKVVGPRRAVAESDSAELVYLQAVVKETLRMHPPGPLLSWARMATSDTYVDGRLVPAGTTAMVNMWAITHDPTVWADPHEFRPDRFLSPGGPASEMSILGSDLRLAPFGSGRRSCPGKGLALATVGFWVATLLHEFEWAVPHGRTGVDLSEVLKLSCEMATPLAVAVRPRRCPSDD